MSKAKSAILQRLRDAPHRVLPDRTPWSPPTFTQKKERFIRLLKEAHADVFVVQSSNWIDNLRQELERAGPMTLLYAPEHPMIQKIMPNFPQSIRLYPYDRPIEDFKQDMVHLIDASLTSSFGAIAETGSIVLWPDDKEPRLMSLLPPLHIVIVEEKRLFNSLTEMMKADKWSNHMPTNLLLISGPSKTADIEQTLAYGVHGPKKLWVFLIENDED
jgi:L-lactate dehydrogenase complex protein LldG